MAGVAELLLGVDVGDVPAGPGLGDVHVGVQRVAAGAPVTLVGLGRA